MITATIEINKLRIRARHGVLVQERIVGNIFEITAHLHYPIDEAIETDDISTTLDYAEVVDVIKGDMEHPAQLLEHVAGRLRATLLEKFPNISGGKLRIAKITPPISTQLESVAVTLEW